MTNRWSLFITWTVNILVTERGAGPVVHTWPLMSYLFHVPYSQLPPGMFLSLCPSSLVKSSLLSLSSKDTFSTKFSPSCPSSSPLFLLFLPILGHMSHLILLLESLGTCNAHISSKRGLGPDCFVFDFPHHSVKAFCTVRVQQIKPPPLLYLLCTGIVLSAVTSNFY